MIITDVALQAFANSGTGSKARYSKLLAEDGPAKVHLLVRLLSPVSEEKQQIVAALQIQKGRQKNNKKVDESALLMTEVERLNMPAERVTTFNRFHHIFTLDRYQYYLVVKFLISSYDNDTYSEEAFCKAKVWLRDVVESDKETLKVELNSLTGGELRYREAEFSLDWTAMTTCTLSVEVRMKVNKVEGRMFSTNSLCFVIFGYEARCATWTPLYRSEVLSRPTEFLYGDSAMIFRLAEANLKQDKGALENHLLRIEIFHVVDGNLPKLLASLNTSLKKLRQAKKGTELDWGLNTFQQGEVTGTLTMHDSKVTQTRHFFVLDANLGSVVKSDFIYFALTLTDHRRHPLRRSFRSLKPYYFITHLQDDDGWENLYRSETQTQWTDKHSVRFELAKLKKRDLTTNRNEDPLCIVFNHERVIGKDILIGYLETNLATLSNAGAGTRLRLKLGESWDQAHLTTDDYAIIGQAQKNDFALFLPIHCVFGQAIPEGTNTVSPAVEEIDYETRSSSSAIS